MILLCLNVFDCAQPTSSLLWHEQDFVCLNFHFKFEAINLSEHSELLVNATTIAFFECIPKLGNLLAH